MEQQTNQQQQQQKTIELNWIEQENAQDSSQLHKNNNSEKTNVFLR